MTASTVMDVVRADSEQLEADLRQFQLETIDRAAQFAGAGNNGALHEALRAAFHEPVADALGSKVGQEALRPTGSAPLRPSITYWVYRNYRGFADTSDLEVIRKVAVAVRILLKAAVVLDDIVDDSDIRYGEPALHITHGVPLALNTGIWLISAAIAHAEHPAAAAYLNQVVSGGFVGQAVDMSTRLARVRSTLIAGTPADRREFWQSVATMKTATLFWMPLNAAATALAIPEEERVELHEAMRTIGWASQLFNDLTDFVPEYAPANTYEDFDGLTNRVSLELLAEALPPDLTGVKLREYVLGHDRLGATLVELAEQAVDYKESAKRRIHVLCRTPESADYFDLTIDRKGHVIQQLRDTVRARYA